MINLVMSEAMKLYGELVEALYGKNGFGGATAELYMYRFGFSLADNRHTISSYRAQAVQQACSSLYNLLAFFAENFGAKVFVNERELGPWVKEAGFEHRVHVRVEDAGSE